MVMLIAFRCIIWVVSIGFSTTEDGCELTKTQQVYEIILEQETEESAKAPIYHVLGLMKNEQAIAYYEKSIEIEEKQSPRRDQNLAHPYNNIGSVYTQIGQYPKVLLFYEKTLTIQQQSLPSTHPSLADLCDKHRIIT